ncbi:cuticle protein 10.9-like [Tachypleus tridentatus]|uniref:cuticle protein 10.9-like n=1 Tax=Tachypleus tridentatus TaxID=6853 RepID=UPI003FD05523
MLKVVLLLALVAGVLGGDVINPGYYHPDDYVPPPVPYDYGFQTVDELGTEVNRQEAGDGAGRVTGAYGYTDRDGIYRLVKYIADEKGFRAEIDTSEPGTDNQNPAGVTIVSNPIPAAVKQAPILKEAVAAHPA